MKILIIGRGQDCDVTLNDPYVSRHHAQLIIHDDGKIGIVDLSSKTGTFVNGKRINTEQFLNDTDVVKIGKSILSWQDYITHNVDTMYESEEEDFEDQQHKESFFAKNKKKLIVSLLSLLLIGGGVAYYFLYFNKQEDTVEELPSEDVYSEISEDDYSLLIYESLSEVDELDKNASLQFKDTDSDLALLVYSKKSKTTKGKENKKNDKKLENYKKEVLNELNKKKIKYEVISENQSEINNLDAIILEMKMIKDQKYAKRVFVKGNNNLYQIYTYTSEDDKEDDKVIMDKMIDSFKENEQTEQTEDN